MNPISGVNHQVNAGNQPQRSENRTSNNTGMSFGSVFEAVKKSMDGIMVVAGNNTSNQADFNRDKLEIEEKRKFKTDLEEANDILNQISKIMEKQDPSN